MTPSPFRPRPERVSAELNLAALPIAVRDARRFVRAQLTRWGLTELSDSAGLITTELVANAVAATGSTKMPTSYAKLYDLDLAIVVMRLRLASASLFVEVWDCDLNPPVLTISNELEEHGRGLVLVTDYSKAWDYYSSDAKEGGKVVWAEIDIPAHIPVSCGTTVSQR